MSCQRLLQQSQPKLSNQSCNQLFYLLSKGNKFWPIQKGQAQSVCPLPISRSSRLCRVNTRVLTVSYQPLLYLFQGYSKLSETLQAKSLTAKSIKPLLDITNKSNGTTWFKNVNNCLNTNIYSYLETSVGQSFNVYLNGVRFFTISVN
jgi:hypothetical protein